MWNFSTDVWSFKEFFGQYGSVDNVNCLLGIGDFTRHDIDLSVDGFDLFCSIWRIGILRLCFYSFQQSINSTGI